MSDAVGEHLRQYAIGAKIRALRLAKGIGLVQLGRHSGLSAGLLSKIERGLLVPPLPTLVRIAMVFGVGLDHFFSEQAGPLAISVVLFTVLHPSVRRLRRANGNGKVDHAQSAQEPVASAVGDSTP